MPKWTPSRYALSVDLFVDPHDRMPTAVMLRHPTAPFIPDVKVGRKDWTGMQKLALQYLRAVRNLAHAKKPLFDRLSAEACQAFDNWLEALGNPANPKFGFGWLPVGWPPVEDFHPMSSFVWGKRTVVLLGAELVAEAQLMSVAGGQPRPVFLGSEFGLRVVGHLRGNAGSTSAELHISGFSASLPFGPYLTNGLASSSAKFFKLSDFGGNLKQKADEIKQALRLWEPVFTRLRLHGAPEDKVKFEVQGTSYDHVGLLAAGRQGDPYRFRVRGTAKGKSGDIESLDAFERTVLMADAAPRRRPRAFLQDPASQGDAASLRTRRPTRSSEELEPYLAPTTVEQKPGLFEVKPSIFASLYPLGLGKEEYVRCNQFAELSAEVNLMHFFGRLEGYGIEPKEYFRLARLPVSAIYRTGVRPGPGKDGNTVNARVSGGTWGQSFFDDVGSEQRPQLTLHLALAELAHRIRKRRDPAHPERRAPAHPLGIAADPRWLWHEFAHIALAASVGELELRFAHSVGDALAAIGCDPRSILADTDAARGATFPWVFIPRRHDRCAAHGWSWRGGLYKHASCSADPERVRRRGYWSEQILSSSLFRLYRALGGDDLRYKEGKQQPDRLAREVASEYTLYLILKAVGLLGYVGAVPAHEPDHLVSALIDADIGTEQLGLTAREGKQTLSATRVGGCAHKVIRWAFERQGLYATPGTVAKGPGDPPPVDIYIADGRPIVESTSCGDVDCGPGSYVPVSLGWWPDRPTPTWHAAERAIEVEGDEAWVTVGNRGTKPAGDVEVSVFWAPWPEKKSRPRGIGPRAGRPVGARIRQGRSNRANSSGSARSTRRSRSRAAASSSPSRPAPTIARTPIPRADCRVRGCR